MHYTLPILFIVSIACFIVAQYVWGFILLVLFLVILLRPSVRKLGEGLKKPAHLDAGTTIPKLTKGFDKHGRRMARYKIYRDSGPQDGWVMPGRKAILLVDQFFHFKRPDIPAEMLCEGIEYDFKAYDKSEGKTLIQEQKMEARLRLLAVIAQSTNSDQLKNKLSQYVEEAESRGVNLQDGIMTNPLPTHMI